MAQILLRAFSFLFIIVIGIVMNKSGFVPKDTGAAMKKILINVTLVATIVTNFAAIESMSPAMIMIAGIGLLMNVLMIVMALITSGRKASREDRILNVMCFPGLNIGAFCLPFVQSFLPPIASVTACMLDLGNSIMCTGVTYAFAAEYFSEDKSKSSGFDFKAFGKKLISSAPLDTYIIMLTITMLGLKLPAAVISFIEPMAKANAFVAMLMLGLLFHLELKKEYLSKVFKVVFCRMAVAAVVAYALYTFMPFDLPIRQALVILSFAPMSAVAPAYTGMCGGDEGLASCTNSVTILCSLAAITALLSMMGIHA